MDDSNYVSEKWSALLWLRFPEVRTMPDEDLAPFVTSKMALLGATQREVSGVTMQIAARQRADARPPDTPRGRRPLPGA